MVSVYRAGRRVGLPLEQCRNFLLLFCWLVLFATGCSKKSESPRNITVQHEISPNPARVGQITVALRVNDSESKPVTGAHVAVEADMSHAGMAPVFSETKEIDPGRYQAQLMLGMAGDWVIIVHVDLAGRQEIQRQFDLRGVEPAVEPGAHPNQASR